MVQAQNALDLDGVDDFISIPNTSFSIIGGAGITISCFVFPRNTTAGWPDMDGFVGFRNNLNTDFYLIQTTPSNIEARFRNSSSSNFDINYGGFTLNSWNHFVLAYDGSMLRLYHDGLPVDSIAASGAITDPSESFFLGDLYFGPGDDFFLDGILDEVGIWSRALGQSEVACLYESGPNLTDPDLQHYYHCNQGVASGNNTGVNYLEDQMTLMNGSLFGFALNGSTSNWVNGTSFEFHNLNEEICEGDTFNFNGQDLTTSGTYFTSYSAQNGCDSSIVLNLTVHSVNVGVSQNGADLMANASGAAYQWIDCADSTVIPGANGQNFTAPLDGDYAVIVTENACSDTSGCYTVSTIGIADNDKIDLIKVHPNPARDHLFLDIPPTVGTIDLEIINSVGIVIYSANNLSGKQRLALSKILSGTYFVVMRDSNENNNTFKLVKW